MPIKTKTKKYRRKTKIKLSWQSANKIITVLTVAAMISFVICINNIAIKGFMIKDLKLRIVELKENNEKYDLRIAELKNLDNLYEKAAGLNMVKVDKIDYLSAFDGSVAVSK